MIVIHDHFPALRPLWNDGRVVSGPAVAVSRLQSENSGIAVVPLEELRWPTKLGSRITSLSLIGSRS